MTPEELTSKLPSVEYRKGIPDSIIKQAKKHNMVLVFGASDDLVEFDGAFRCEIDAENGQNFRRLHISQKGVAEDGYPDEESEEFKEMVEDMPFIDAYWCKEGADFSWVYDTKIPHSTFDIFDGDEQYCKAIVFSLSDLKP